METKSARTFRLSAMTERQLDLLTQHLGTSITETLTVAIDRMYQQDITTAIIERVARKRVAKSANLDAYQDTIFYEWPNWNEHMEWIATASESEIVDWAQTIEKE